MLGSIDASSAHYRPRLGTVTQRDDLVEVQRGEVALGRVVSLYAHREAFAGHAVAFGYVDAGMRSGDLAVDDGKDHERIFSGIARLVKCVVGHTCVVEMNSAVGAPFARQAIAGIDEKMSSLAYPWSRSVTQTSNGFSKRRRFGAFHFM